MSWTPDAKSAAILEQIMTRARARAITGFLHQAWMPVASRSSEAGRRRPLRHRSLMKARAIIHEFGRVTVSEVVNALRQLSGGSIPLETLGGVGLALTGEIQELVKTLAGQMDGVRNAHLNRAIGQLQGAGRDATLEVEYQLGKAALLPPVGTRPARRS